MRAVAPDLWILAPGVGAQGGNLRGALVAGLRPDGRGIIVPVSRGISRAESPKAAAEELVAIMRQEIQQFQESQKTTANTSSTAVASANLQDYQQSFIEVCLKMQVLRFGSFTLKSGRTSPYFFNAGHFSTGAAMLSVAQCYAQVILDSKIEYDVVFGPAYKGIPLAAAVAMALDSHPSREAGSPGTAFAYVFSLELHFYYRIADVFPLCWFVGSYNRKEAKDHGEGGSFVGADLRGKRVLLVDDVITAGTAIRESIKMLAPIGATVTNTTVTSHLFMCQKLCI